MSCVQDSTEVPGVSEGFQIRLPDVSGPFGDVISGWRAQHVFAFGVGIRDDACGAAPWVDKCVSWKREGVEETTAQVTEGAKPMSKPVSPNRAPIQGKSRRIETRREKNQNGRR